MNLKRIACIILALILSLPLALPVNSYASNFTDTYGHWAEFYISKVFNEKIIKGYPDGRFMPDKAVTRAEFVAMVNEVFELDDVNTWKSLNLSDVSYTSWYYTNIATAFAAGYAWRYSDNTFKPNTPITRQEAAVMLAQLIPEGKTKGKLKVFSDYKQIDSEATDAMTKLVGKGYFGAYSDNKLHPKDSVTRAQASKIMSEILDNEDIITRKTIVDEDKAELTNKIYVNNVLIDEDLEEGTAIIDNCIILGGLTIEGGGGKKGITINNTRVTKAILNREDGKVKVVTKGDTVISKLEASESCYLQTSGKGGLAVPDITVKKMANLTLKGTFPLVNIEGSRANVTLESGKVTDFKVTGAGKYSDITLTGKSEISDITVNSECYFHGEGTIVNMLVNADNVTYETKPDKMTVGLRFDRPQEGGDDDVSATFKPKTKAANVDIDTKITITFNTSMEMENGKGIKDSNIKDFISFHKWKRSGDEVAFSASINNSKKVITITPDARLSKGTKYYVVLEKAALQNAGKNKNHGESIYFTTEGELEEETP